MPRLSPEEKLARAQDAKAKALAELRSAAGQISAKNRKLDLRRKIVLGGLVMRLMSNPSNTTFADSMKAWLEKLPPRDRALFDGWSPPAPRKKKAT
jgi:hypothetical protein